VSNETEGIKLYKELFEWWGKVGMHTHKWLLNSLKVLEAIPQQYRATEMNDKSLPVNHWVFYGLLMMMYLLLSHRPVKGYSLQPNEVF